MNPMTKHPFVLLLASLALLPAAGRPASPPQIPTISVRSIDYFGYRSLDLTQFRAHLPIHPGDALDLDGFDQVKERIQPVARRFTGKPATNIAAVCCGPRIGCKPISA
jgi:hypothetical protein